MFTMDFNAFIGTWEIIGCGYIIGTPSDNHRLEGIRFRLDENGDVTWTSVPEELKSVPLFSCETYEMYYVSSGLGVVIRFGPYAGHVLEFESDLTEPRDKLIITCEGWVMLHCKRVHEDASNDTNLNLPFTLLPALEGGYFSDITIQASNKKQFKVHSCILQLQAEEIDWNSEPIPFSDLPEDVLGTILHYLYTESLPENLNEHSAKLVIDSITNYSCLNKLASKCKLYLKNMAIKQQIIGLVNDMHSCIDQIIEHFNLHNTIQSNHVKLCFAVKQSIRDSAIVGVKLLLLCDLFTQRKNDLTKDERHEIIRYAKSRLPIFLVQLQGLLQALKTTFSSLSAAQRFEIATFLVPEIEIILDTFSTLIEQIERALEQIINVSANDNSRNKSGIGDLLGKSLKNVLHIKELSKLRGFHEQINYAYDLLLQKKENFVEMTLAQKIRSISRNLEQLIEELPIFMLRLEEVTTAFDEKLEWRDFKFCFKVGTSKVSRILQKLITHRNLLQNVIMQLCELVQRDVFQQSLMNLGLLENGPMCSSSSETETSSNATKNCSYKLNLVESLCIPPLASSSLLSKQLLESLKNSKDTDMEFEIVSAENDSENNVIKAHRVIVAARCDWFRRALSSGMKESIDKKILIHDTNPMQFHLFLEYLYCGKLNQQLTTEQLVELLLLSDRYEVDSLKQTCELLLQNSIDIDSALYFLSMADQYNATILKTSCLNFISQHHELTENEVFFELPIALQAEIFDCVWTTQSPTQPPKNSVTMTQLLPTSPTSSSECRVNFPFHRSDSDPLGNLPMPTDAARMENCLEQLTDIIPAASQEELVQIVLAADYNLCRAVNFYYSRRNDDNTNVTDNNTD